MNEQVATLVDILCPAFVDELALSTEVKAVFYQNGTPLKLRAETFAALFASVIDAKNIAHAKKVLAQGIAEGYVVQEGEDEYAWNESWSPKGQSLSGRLDAAIVRARQFVIREAQEQAIAEANGKRVKKVKKVTVKRSRSTTAQVSVWVDAAIAYVVGAEKPVSRCEITKHVQTVDPQFETKHYSNTMRQASFSSRIEKLGDKGSAKYSSKAPTVV